MICRRVQLLSCAAVVLCFAGMPKLKLVPMNESRNVRPQCTGELSPRHVVVPFSINSCEATGECIVSWQALQPKEQYCSTQQFYAGRHAHCKAGIAAYAADDLRLLYGSGMGHTARTELST